MAFHIDSHTSEAESAVIVPEGRDLENAPVEDGAVVTVLRRGFPLWP